MEKKYIKINFIVLFILILFHTLFEKLITTLLINPIFSQVNTSYINDILVLIILLYIIIDSTIKIKKNIYLSKRYIIIILNLFSIYFYYRFLDKQWSFTKMHFFDLFVYTDLFILFILFEIIKKINFKQKEEKIDSKLGFIFDNPLGKKGKDQLQREKYAKKISSKIENTKNKENAFAIGINGNWGVGKTSFLNLIERNLDKSESIVLKFNPWLNNGSNSIVNEFFKNLSYEIEKHNPSLSTKIDKYGKLLLEINDSNLDKIIKPIIYFKKRNNVAQTEYKEISNRISKLDKKLIIFIDDIDRLDNDEIIEVIRIIRNTANFPNTIFIAAYDRNYVIKALEKNNSSNNEYFLEKIFQLEIQLPEYEIETIKNWVLDLVKIHLTEKDYEELRKTMFKKIPSFIGSNHLNPLNQIITTLRDATRFSNSFLLTYSELQGEVNIEDLYFLELIKLKYSGVYNLILKEKDSFLTLTDDNKTGYSNGNHYFYSLKKIKDDKSGQMIYIIEKYLSENYLNIGVQKKDLDIIIELLKRLFPNKPLNKSNFDLLPLSIADPSCFDRYSHYRLLNSNLSQNEFEENLLKSSEEFNEKMLEWSSLYLRGEISEKLRRFKHFENKQQFENLIVAIFNFGRIQVEGHYPGYDYIDLRNKIESSEKIKLNKFYNNNREEYQLFLKEIFINAPSPYIFDLNLIYNILKTIHFGFILDKEFLENQRIIYFKKYLNSIPKFNDIIFKLYNDCSLVNNDLISPEISNSNPEANKLLINFIKEKDLDGFLNRMVLLDYREEKKFHVNPFVKRLFGEFSEFKLFLSKFSNSDFKYLEEFNDFFLECEKVKFEVYIDFNFKKIIKKK